MRGVGPVGACLDFARHERNCEGGCRRTAAAVAGFTLVELLIALFLFALLSAAATALLRFGVDASGRTAERLGTLAAVNRSRALLGADLAQAAPRVWRDSTGARAPAFIGNGAAAGDGLLFGVIRRGWRNEGAAARSSLQRVEYRLRAGNLERQAWPMVDGAAPYPPARLLSRVTAVRVRFHAEGEWRDAWDGESADALPAAVEMTITAAGIPELRQAFLVGPATGVVRAEPPL